MKQEKSKGNLIIKITTIILILFLLLCMFVVIKSEKYNLIPSILGILTLIITINIANIIRISKEKVKFFSIISIILSLVAMVLLFKQTIFSLALSIPAFIISKKAFSKDGRQLITKISLILSIISIFACVLTFIVRFTKLNNLYKTISK